MQFTSKINGGVYGNGLQYKVHGQSGAKVLRFPGSGILVACRHHQIFMAAQVWHEMSQMVGARAFF